MSKTISRFKTVGHHPG